ncbi:MAG: hypothetical protein SNJ63_06990 [Sphingomonadaceae bacterium]
MRAIAIGFVIGVALVVFGGGSEGPERQAVVTAIPSGGQSDAVSRHHLLRFEREPVQPSRRAIPTA